MNTTAKSIVKNIGKGFQKHWPKIATAFGGVLLVTAGYLAGREVPKYKEELERKREEKGEDLSAMEKGKIAAKQFVAPACALVGGSMFLVVSACENDKRIAKVGSAACLVSEMTSKNMADYVETTKQVVGEEKAKEIEEKVKEKKVDRLAEAIDISEPLTEGKYWCYDTTFGGKPFMTDLNTLQAAENEITRRCLQGDEVTLNDAYELIGHEYIDIANVYGWRFDDCYKAKDVASLGVSTILRDGKPAFTITPNVKIIDEQFYVEAWK